VVNQVLQFVFLIGLFPRKTPQMHQTVPYSKKCQMHIHDESSRCVGQSIVAASLPEIKK